MKRIKEILLIDDSKGILSLSKRLLEEMDFVDKISTASNGLEALSYLTTKREDGAYPIPELIFLDINMPVMDGYQFLEKCEEKNAKLMCDYNVVMLTTSMNEIDKQRARHFSCVKAYQTKPLRKENVIKILTRER